MSAPLGLGLYRATMAALGPFASAWLSARARKGKEDAARLNERFGRSLAERPPGALIWLHAASVGEMGVALTLIEALRARRDARFLLTTGTRASAELFAKRRPDGVIHHYVPLDHPRFAQRFMAHWRPSLAVFIESELWPNLLRAAKRHGAPLALVNARMNEATLRRWQRTPDSARAVLDAFDVIIAADQRTADGLARLSGRAVACEGNLKLAAAFATDEAAVARLRAAFGATPVWLAASTHAGEDEIVIDAHKQILQRRPDARLVIAPRHPERGEAIARLAGDAPRRAHGEDPAGHSFYVADTMGELNAFYAAVPVALVCGSLLPHLSGHNPIEPARAGAAILTGPYVKSFADLFDEISAAGGAWTVETAEAIAAAVESLWSDAPRRARLIRAAADVAGRGAPALETTLQRLEMLLDARKDRPDARA